jgi:hypothetical protein
LLYAHQHNTTWTYKQRLLTIAVSIKKVNNSISKVNNTNNSKNNNTHDNSQAVMSKFLEPLRAFRPYDFDVSTWLILGACIQSVLVATLPRNLSLLPPIALLLYRYIRSYLIATGTLSNPLYEHVTHGRQTWQIPSADGSPGTTGASESVVVLVLAASWTHPNGRFSPGSQELGNYFANMWADANSNREKYGFLGNTPQMATEDDGSRQDGQGVTLVFLSYWKTLEGLHQFAHAAAHMKGQLWWEKGAIDMYKHIGISHEVYEVPAGNWENVYHNFRPFGISEWKSKKISRPCR